MYGVAVKRKSDGAPPGGRTRDKRLERTTPSRHTGHHYGDDGVCTECGEKKPGESKNFFRKIADFFRKIVNWFKNLFKRG